MRNEEMRARLTTLLQAKVAGDAAAIRTLDRFYDALSPGPFWWINGPNARPRAHATNDNA